MSEKRFILKRSNALSSNYRLGERVYDTVLKKELYNLEVVDLLNEQQATIDEQKEAIDYLKTVIRYTIPNQMVADVFKRIGEEYE